MSVGRLRLPVDVNAVSAAVSSNGRDGEPSGPLDDLVDAAVFAPLGLALEYRKLMPELAEKGRKQVAFARTLGRAALSTMASSAARKSAPSTAPSPAATPSASPEPVAADAVIEGYDAMTAKAVIALASTASPSELAWMIEREQGGKQRKTVLAKLTQLSD